LACLDDLDHCSPSVLRSKGYECRDMLDIAQKGYIGDVSFVGVL
jgi:hypothetical protein